MQRCTIRWGRDPLHVAWLCMVGMFSPRSRTLEGITVCDTVLGNEAVGCILCSLSPYRWRGNATSTSLCVSPRLCSLWPSLTTSGRPWRQSWRGRSARRTRCLCPTWMRALLTCLTLGASPRSSMAKVTPTSAAGAVCHPDRVYKEMSG